MQDWESMLDELLELEQGLTGWEIDFLESLDKLRGRELSEKQLEKLTQIHERLK
jgi:hypothetical protein